MTGSVTTSVKTSGAYVPKKNPDLVHRIVGFLEYQKALEHLDALVRASTPEELKVIDELVKEREEFTVYTNVSRRVNPGPSSLNESDPKGTNFKQGGLAWVTALARVELGAMLAAFTEAKHPFEMVRPTPYDMNAYKEMLADGLRFHYWSLANSPATKAVIDGKTTPEKLLVWGRRLTLARHFLRAAAKAGSRNLTPLQVAELKKWDGTLEDVHGSIVINVVSLVQQNSSASLDAYLIACPPLQAAVRKELAAGTAKIRPLPPRGAKRRN